MWMPGHCGIEGNEEPKKLKFIEETDELTRDEANQSCQGPELYLEITRKRPISALNVWIKKTMNKEWRNLVGCRLAKIITGYSPARINRLIGNNRKHPRLKRRLLVMGIDKDATCPCRNGR